MAKKPTTNGEKTVDISVPADFAISTHGLTITASDLETMSAKALGYLLANGYKQSITDAAAFTKEKKAGKSAADLEAMANDSRAKRHEAILAGNVGAVVGSRATPIESFMRDVAHERLKALCLSLGKPLPKNVKGGAQTYSLAIEAILKRQGDDIRAEAEARMAAAKGAAADVADILG